MLVNFLWFSTGDKDFTLRWLTNPKPVQTDYFGTGPLVHFVGFLNKIPVIEMLVALIVVLGAIYYFGFQRNKPFRAVIPPEEEVEGVTV